jgi:hypothetical protein
MDQPTMRRTTKASVGAAILGLVGTAVSWPAAALFGITAGEYPSRMECTRETLGSGCYEGDVFFAAAIFAAFHLPFFAPSLLMALRHRGAGNRVALWWPFVVLCAVPLATIAVAALSVAGQASP